MRLLSTAVDRAQLAVLDLGERGGSATVYLGGLGSASTVAFAEVVGHPRMAGRGRHVLVDLVGSGWSDGSDTFPYTIEAHARTIADVIDALGLKEVTLVGHSLGGSIAIELASRRGDVVRRLTVAEPNLDAGVGTFSAQIARFEEDEFVSGGMQQIMNGWDGIDRVTLARWSPRGLHRTAISLLSQRPVSFREQLTELPIAKTYLSGEFTGEDLGTLRGTGCDVMVVPGAGHSMMADNLDGFVACVVRGWTNTVR